MSESSSAAQEANVGLTDAEAAIYDRQIRLWGVEAQQNMRNGRILISGLNTLGAEVTKNSVLAGINVVIQDHKIATDVDAAINFFLTEEDMNTKRAEAALHRIKEMNTLVDVSCETRSLEELSDDFLRAFRLVVLCDSDLAAQIAVSARLRSLGVPVIAAAVMGTWGSLFEDLGSKYTYEHQMKKTVSLPDGQQETQVSWESRELEYPSITQVLAPEHALPIEKIRRMYKWRAPQFAWSALMRLASEGAPVTPDAVVARVHTLLADSKIDSPPKEMLEPLSEIARAFVEGQGVELVPVAAILAGIVSNEIVKVMTRKLEPIRNVFILDGMGPFGGSVHLL